MKNFAKLFTVSDGSEVLVMKKNQVNHGKKKKKDGEEEFQIILIDGTDDVTVERTFGYIYEDKRDDKFNTICQKDVEVWHVSLLALLAD